MVRVKQLYFDILSLIETSDNDIKILKGDAYCNFLFDIKLDLPCLTLGFGRDLESILISRIKISVNSTDNLEEKQTKAYHDLSIEQQIKLFLDYLEYLQIELERFILYWNEEIE